MLCPDELPQPADGKRNTLLLNHVDGAKVFHACGTNHNAMVKTVCSMVGVTVNGQKPSDIPACKSLISKAAASHGARDADETE